MDPLRKMIATVLLESTDVEVETHPYDSDIAMKLRSLFGDELQVVKANGTCLSPFIFVSISV